MKEFKDKNLNQRLQNAAKAKQALLERMKAMPAADFPEVLAKKAARQAIVEAREARTAAKAIADRERAEREAREAAERAVREAEEKAALKAREDEEYRLKIEQQDALEAEQKAARDARYAARKKRKS